MIISLLCTTVCLREMHGSECDGGVNMVREAINLECGECKNRNYRTMKNKRNTPDRLVLKKYCKFCRKHTEHKETR